MKQVWDKGWRIWTLAVVAIGIASIAPAAAGLQQSMEFDTERLEVRNLIGAVKVESHAGSEFEVLVDVQGKDAREGMITLDAKGDVLNVRFPTGVTEFVYPVLGSRGSTKFGGGGGGWISELLGGGKQDRITVRGSGSGLEVWADLTIRVPDGSKLEVKHGVGALSAEGVDAGLELATNSGDVSISNSRGEIEIATGSGDVTLTRLEGRSAEVATGSGDVRAEDCAADSLEVATGSGDIRLSGIRGDEVEIATGSGDIEARGIESESFEVGTGSGGVSLELDRLGAGEISVGTGSGDIEVSLPPGASARIHAETHGGEVRVDLPGDLDYRVKESDEVRLTIGGGDARIDLGTGNGDIRIRG